MTKLLYSSEKIGCGATMELDSGEICLVSVAKAGVLVRSSKGLFSRTMVGIFGAILYNETNVYKAVQTSIALDTLFVERPNHLTFQSPVLNAFANAIWHCPTAANVAVTLNTATEKAASLAVYDNEIISDYFKFMDGSERNENAFYDVMLLPHRKSDIVSAIERTIIYEASGERLKLLVAGALLLLQFQECIGSKPLYWVGLDLGKFNLAYSDLSELMAQVRGIPNTSDRESAERHIAIMKAENDHICNRISAAVRLRNATISAATHA